MELEDEKILIYVYSLDSPLFYRDRIFLLFCRKNLFLGRTPIFYIHPFYRIPSYRNRTYISHNRTYHLFYRNLIFHIRVCLLNQDWVLSCDLTNHDENRVGLASFQNASRVSCPSEERFPWVGHHDACQVLVRNLDEDAEASYHAEDVHHGEACHQAWVHRASAFPSAYDAYPNAYSPYPIHDAHDRNHAPYVHAHGPILPSAPHAHAQDAPVQIPAHGFQSHVQDLRLLPTHLRRGDRRDHHGALHHLIVTMFTENGMPLGPTLLFGDLAGFHRLLDAFTYFMQFVFVILCLQRRIQVNKPRG